MSYLLPTTPTQPISLEQFIQTVLVGISGLPQEYVRPKNQPNPPKMPDIQVNWMAFGMIQSQPDSNSYLEMDINGVYHSQRHETLRVLCSLYGPNALDYADIIRDGFQIPQNRDALLAMDMGFVEVGQIIPVPDLVNERWVRRYEMEVILRRQINRTYSVQSLLSATGTIHAVVGGIEINQDFSTPGGI